MKLSLTIFALCFVLAGCATPRAQDDSQAPAPAPIAQAPVQLRSPFEVVGDFRATLQTELVLTALHQLDTVNYGTPEADRVQLRMKRLSLEMSRDGYDFKPVEENIIASSAAVIVRENAQRTGSPQFGVFYLIRREHGWKLSPEPGDYRKFRALSQSQLASYQKLETWFQRRRAELIADERAGAR